MGGQLTFDYHQTEPAKGKELQCRPIWSGDSRRNNGRSKLEAKNNLLILQQSIIKEINWTRYIFPAVAKDCIQVELVVKFRASVVNKCGCGRGDGPINR